MGCAIIGHHQIGMSAEAVCECPDTCICPCVLFGEHEMTQGSAGLPRGAAPTATQWLSLGKITHNNSLRAGERADRQRRLIGGHNFIHHPKMCSSSFLLSHTVFRPSPTPPNRFSFIYSRFLANLPLSTYGEGCEPWPERNRTLSKVGPESHSSGNDLAASNRNIAISPLQSSISQPIRGLFPN